MTNAIANDGAFTVSVLYLTVVSLLFLGFHRFVNAADSREQIPAGEVTILSEAADLKEFPLKDGKLLRRLPRSSRATLVSRYDLDGWYLVEFKGVKGWLEGVSLRIRLFDKNLTSVAYQRQTVREVGSMILPTEMIVSKNPSKEVSWANTRPVIGNLDAFVTRESIGRPRVTFQSSMARITISTERRKKGTVAKLSDPIGDLDIETMSTFSDSQMWEMGLYKGDKVFVFLARGDEVLKIRGVNCVRRSYLRTRENGPPELVEFYKFQNHDRVHYLTTSYNYEFADKWKPILGRVVSSFEIVLRR